MIVGRMDFGDPNEDGQDVEFHLRLTHAEAEELRCIVNRGMLENRDIQADLRTFLAQAGNR